MQEASFDSGNINTLWLHNIYENLHNLEEQERLSREGVSTLVDYANLPKQERESIIADLQYKNLKMMVSETYLLLTDILPVVNEDFHTKKKKFLDGVSKHINDKRLFLHSPVNQKTKTIIKIELKPLFYETLTIITDLRQDIIKELSHLLYVKHENDE